MPHILIVDDDHDVRDMLHQMIERAGYRVSTAGNGREALRFPELDSVDLVITDLLMPEMEGIEFIRELKTAYPGIAVIAISGGNRYVLPTSQLRVAQHLGANRTLAKPVERAQLLEAIKSTLADAQTPNA